MDGAAIASRLPYSPRVSASVTHPLSCHRSRTVLSSPFEGGACAASRATGVTLASSTGRRTQSARRPAQVVASLPRPPVGLGAEGALAEELAVEAVEDVLGTGGANEAVARCASAVDGADSAWAAMAVENRFWEWRGHRIRYQTAGTEGPALLLVHGFGANCDHWRKNLPFLAQSHRVFAFDLLGYGLADKPTPPGRQRRAAAGDATMSGSATVSPYTFENWAAQAADFIDQVVGEEAFIITNSVGGIVALQAAVSFPSRVRALLLLNVSVRNLHISKQQWFARPFVALLQHTLRTTDLGNRFFASVATPRAVKNILQQCYGDPSTVTDELVDLILQPGLRAGAVDVFLDFICYSGGPLPEELLQQVRCPVLLGWGTADPWEPVHQGRQLAAYDSVVGFEELEGVGHCPQDEAPHLVNPLIARFVTEYSG